MLNVHLLNEHIFAFSFRTFVSFIKDIITSFNLMFPARYLITNYILWCCLTGFPFYSFFLPSLPPLSSLLPPSSFFLPLPPSFLLLLALIKLLIIKIWSLLGLQSQSLIFKVGNCLVYTKLNLLAFYFCGIWHRDGTAFYLLQVSAVSFPLSLCAF